MDLVMIWWRLYCSLSCPCCLENKVPLCPILARTCLLLALITIQTLPPVLLVSAASFPNASWGFSQKSVPFSSSAFLSSSASSPFHTHYFLQKFSWHPGYYDAIKHIYFCLCPLAQHTVPTILELLQVTSCFVTCQGNSGSWDLFLWPNSVAVCCSEESTAWLECCNFQIHHPLDFCRGKKCKSSGWAWRANDSFNQAFPMMDSAKSQWMSQKA